MTASEFTQSDLIAAAGWARADLYDFSRWMFLQRRGYKWQRADHHRLICDALMRVYRGECKRLVINVPPRYSKCSPHGTMVLTPKGQRDIAILQSGDTVYSHDHGRLVRRIIKATERFRKACVTVRSKSGRALRVSGDHPVLTQRGWIEAQYLTSEHYLIRVCTAIDGADRLPDSELDFITLMLFEGGCSDSKNLRFTSADERIVSVFRESAAALGIGITQYPSQQAIDYNIKGGASGTAAKLLDKHGLRGCLARVKRLPPAIFNLPIEQKYRFLSLMFATDGYVIKRHGQLAVTLASEPLIDDISLLLDTCGVPSRKYAKKNDHAGAWELCIGASHIKRLAGKIDLLQKQSAFETALEHPSRESTIFGYPYDVAKGQTYRCKQVRPKIDFKHAGVLVSDAKFERMIEEVDSSLVKWKMDDFIYDRVATVEASGDDDVYHLEIDEQDYDAKNYIASGYVVHNTELAVINFMAWAIGKTPDAEFIHASYSGRLATGNSWQCRELVSHPAYAEIFTETRLRQDSQARDEWRTTAGGCVYAVGAGGTITGYGAGKMREGFGGALILDDLHKADEARSDVIREGVIDWFQNTLESRKNSPDTPIILIMQRLHERDIAGWLLEGGNGEKWERLILPALREDGTALWPEKHTVEELKRMEMASPYTFAGQYQQSPSSPAGNIIKPDMMPIIDAIPHDMEIKWFRAWDLASTVPKQGSDPDWTVGSKWGRDKNGRFYIGDIVRLRGGPDEVEAAIVNTAARDSSRVTISLPQDPGQAGKSQILYLTKKLTGYKVRSSPETGDKITRAEPMAAQINVGNVSMLKSDWNNALISEMRMFPNSSHDDQVDACSRAFSELIAPRQSYFG